MECFTNVKMKESYEKTNIKINNRLIGIESKVWVYSTPDLILIKENKIDISHDSQYLDEFSGKIGKHISEIIHQYLGSELEAVLKIVLKTEKIGCAKEVRFDDDNGTTYWDFVVTPIFEDRKMKYIFLTSVDVTERVLNNQNIEKQKKIIEEKMKKLEDKNSQLVNIIENLSEGVIIIDSESKYKLINKSAREMFTEDSECSSKVSNWKCECYGIDGEKIEHENIPSRRISRGEKLKNVKLAVQFSKKVLQVDVSGTPIYDRKGDFSLGVLCYKDMTSYYKQEKALKSRNDFLTRLIYNLEVPVIGVSANDLRVLKINQKALDNIELFGEKIKTDVKIKGNIITEILTDFSGSKYFHKIMEVIKEKKTKYLNKQKSFINGNEIYWNIIFEPIFEVDGELKEVIILIIDITSEVKSNIIMEKSLELHEEFLANISHELKTPLNVVFATAQLLNMYCNNGSLDKRKNSIIKYIESIKKNSYRLSKIINNIVDLSKIEAGFFDLNLSNNNIVEVVEEIVMSVTDFTDIKGINIIFDTYTEEKIIACDPEKIERIVLNLISNAIKFSNKGSEIFVDINTNNEFVEISVKDNGIGMEDDDLMKIFDRFKQVDKSLSRNAEGTGIGLSLVKSLVELHGGSIKVQSKLGQGSKFTVALPSKKVGKESMFSNSNIRNITEIMQVELSDISLSS
jgi:signal transduction histidine kinase